MSNDQSDFGAFIAGFVLGGLVGASVALLMAPQSGEETRTVIRDKSIELKDKAVVTAEEARVRAEKAAADARARAEELAEQTKTKSGELAQRSQVVLDEGKSRISDAIEKGKKVVKRQTEAAADEAVEEPPADAAEIV
jgi:gas vesicle protein